jgi:hypothetical protein
MATVYISPTGGAVTQDGTTPDTAYAYSSTNLNTAESDAGNGGTILFLDGTYTFTANQTWDAGGFADMTYKSLNDNGAYLLGSLLIRAITYGSATTTTVTIEGFKSENVYYTGNHLQGTSLTLAKINHADTISGTRANRGIIHTGIATNVCTISDVSFIADYSGNDRLFNNLTNSTISRCSFLLKCTSIGSEGITNNGGFPTTSNTIFMSDNSNAIADSVLDPSKCTNCCIYQMHTNDSSGGTDNIFADPQFVDAPNGDLRLRPSSPCIGAGTAS